MVILKKPEVENCTPYWIEGSEILQPVPKNNLWYGDASAKDYFPKLLDNLTVCKDVRFRGVNPLIVYKGVMVNSITEDIYLMFTKENIIYINSSSYYPKAWITFIGKALKEKGLNPNKCIKFLNPSELDELFKFTLTFDFSDYEEDNQKKIMESVKGNIVDIYSLNQELTDNEL